MRWRDLWYRSQRRRPELALVRRRALRPRLLLEHERHDRPGGQVVRELAVAELEVEALGARPPVVVVRHDDYRAVAVAEGDVPNVAAHRGADPHGARPHEARDVAEHVVVRRRRGAA